MQSAPTSPREPGADAPPAPCYPELQDGVELIGQMTAAGYENPPWLIRRGTQFLQVSELLFRVAEEIDGERTLEEIAAAVTARTPWLVTPENVEQIDTRKLLPLGIVYPLDDAGDAPVLALPPARSVVGLVARTQLIGPRAIDGPARLLRLLYWPPLLVVLLALVALAQWRLFAGISLSALADASLRSPGFTLGLLGVLALSGLVHEFGHAAALRYGGGRSSGMGVGIVVFYPAFYTNTSDAYRLGRGARVRTDLGGFYFHLLYTALLVLLYRWSGYPFLAGAVLLIDADIVRQLIPFLRLDGYWTLADLTGVPDLYSMLGGALPWRRGRQATGAHALKRHARWIVTGYMLVSIPLLVVVGGLFLLHIPGLVSGAWGGLREQARSFSHAYDTRDAAGMTLAAFGILFLQVQLIGIALILGRQLLRLGQALRRWSGRSLRHALAGGGASLLALGVFAYLWLVPWLR